MAAANRLGEELEEVQKLGLAVLLVAAAGHLTGRDLKRSEQDSGAIALAVVGRALRQTGPD